jgi:hypothetical protein
MAKVTVEFGELVIEIEGIDALWALRSQLEIPLAHVRGAAMDAGLAANPPCRDRATPVPGAVGAGALLQHDGNVFWDVSDPAKVVVIELVDERYARLMVEVDDPVATVTRINRAIAEQHAR